MPIKIWFFSIYTLGFELGKKPDFVYPADFLQGSFDFAHIYIHINILIVHTYIYVLYIQYVLLFTTLQLFFQLNMNAA